MDRDELKRRVSQEIDRRGDELIRVAQAILDHPEPGFREVKTSALVEEKLREMGIPHQSCIAVTGVKGRLDGGSPGPTVGVIGELDSLIVPGHSRADPATGAAHACGHHAQIGMMLAVAAGLQAQGVLPQLSGGVALFAVPAEEYIELEFRQALRQQGKIQYLGGKPEFIRLGHFDDIDAAMMTHVTSNEGEKRLAIEGTNNGMLAKLVQFQGRAAHAGGAPHKGINALNAAQIALNAIHAQRETFQERDSIRIHPIITKGGDSVNSVPADVRMETFVRGRTTAAITDADAKVERSLRAGAMAVGASVSITTLPGYLPLASDKNLSSIYRSNAASLVGEDEVAQIRHRASSTDMGDVTQILPAIHPYAGGAEGAGHGADYLVRDWENSVLTAAKAMAWTVVDLLAEGAAQAREIKAAHKPRMTKDQYLAFLNSNMREEVYHPEGAPRSTVSA